MGRIPTGKIPENALEYIRPRHRQIMYRLITGQTQAHIATDLEMDQSRLSVIVNSPLFKSELKKMEDDVFDSLKESRGDIAAKVKELQPKALQVISEMMGSKKTGARLRRDCAKDILELDKKRRTNEDDGMTPFAKIIEESFKLAHERRDSANESNGTGNGTGTGNGNGKPSEPTVKNVTPGYEEAIETSAIEVGETTPYEKKAQSPKEEDETKDSEDGPEDDDSSLIKILDSIGV